MAICQVCKRPVNAGDLDEHVKGKKCIGDGIALRLLAEGKAPFPHPHSSLPLDWLPHEVHQTRSVYEPPFVREDIYGALNTEGHTINAQVWVADWVRLVTQAYAKWCSGQRDTFDANGTRSISDQPKLDMTSALALDAAERLGDASELRYFYRNDRLLRRVLSDEKLQGQVRKAHLAEGDRGVRLLLNPLLQAPHVEAS